MRQYMSTQTVNFNMSYFDNFKNNRVVGMINGAKLKRVLKIKYLAVDRNDVFCDDYDGLDVKDYVKNTFNGDSPDCIAEKVAKNITKAWNDVEAEAGRFFDNFTSKPISLSSLGF